MLEAINGNVFVKRDETDEDFNGIDISEGARVASLYGTIVAIGDCDFAKIGDAVHIPHYGVEDVVVDGEEYAMFKEKRIFMVNGDVVNGYVQVRKCENDHVRDDSGEIALYMTDHHIDFTNWVEIIDVPDGSYKMKKEYKGLYCVAPENDDRLARIGYTKDFALHEDLIHFLTEGDR